MAKKEYTENQLKFLDALIGDARGDIKLATKMAGYAETTKVIDIVKALKEEIRALSADALTLNSVKASFTLINLLDSPNVEGASHLIKVASEILDRAGVNESKNQEQANIPQGGLLILPAKGSHVSLDINPPVPMQLEKTIELERIDEG